MAPTVQLAREERRTRWFRRIAPIAVLLGLLVLLLIPGMLSERRPEDATSRATPLTHVTPSVEGEQAIGPAARSFDDVAATLKMRRG